MGSNPTPSAIYRLKFPAISSRQKCDGVHDLDIQDGCLRAVTNLAEATGVSGRDDQRAGRGNVFHFAFQQRPAHLGLGDVLNARRPAAPRGFGQLDQFHTRNRAQ